MALPPLMHGTGLRPKGLQNAVHGARAGGNSGSILLIRFVLLGIFCQVALLAPQLARFRVPLRVAPFLASLALLLIPGAILRHPAHGAALAAMGALLLCVLNSLTYLSPVASAAQVGLYLAIIAPIIWVGRYQITLRTITLIVVLLWSFHTLSAFFGVLQTLYPGQYQPAMAATLTQNDFDRLSITLKDGSVVLRPMGLTDSPGGASTSGYTAVLFGLGILLTMRSRAVSIAAALSVGIGFYVIYLSMVRVVLVTLIISVIAAAAAFAARNDVPRLTKLLLVAGFSAILGYLAALAIGGEIVSDRVSSLVEHSAGKVYQENRGMFLTDTWERLLPMYPFGAGPGRWGMMLYYFGKAENAIHAEIQWTGWLLDGGVPFVLAYSFAVLATTWSAWVSATIRGNEILAVWAVLIFARDISVIAMTFSYPIFVSQSGMEFWFLNACLFVAVTKYNRENGKEIAQFS